MHAELTKKTFNFFIQSFKNEVNAPVLNISFHFQSKFILNETKKKKKYTLKIAIILVLKNMKKDNSKAL